MAIAFDAATDGAGGGTTLSWSHTCTGSNRCLIVFISGAQSNNDYVSGVDYAGAAMTLVAKIRTPGDRFTYLFVLANPASGSNTITVNTSSTPDALYGSAASYTGVNQTNPTSDGASFSASSTSSVSPSTSVTYTNCWLVFGTHNTFGTASAGSGTTRRIVGTGGAEIFDSNGTVGTGSQSLNATAGGAGNWGGVIVALRPPSTTFNQTLTATQGQTATISRATTRVKALSATQGQSATTIPQLTKLKTLSATQSSTAIIQRIVNKILRASQSQIAALGTAIVFANPAWTYVSVNGVPRAYGRTDNVSKTFASSLKIVDVINDTPNTCSFTAAGWTPTVGMDIVIALGGTSNPDRMFGGVVLIVKPSYVGTERNPIYTVTCTDYTWLMNRRKVTKRFTNKTVAEIAAVLITYSPGYTVNVQSDVANIVIDEITFTDQEVTTCFSQLMGRETVGGYWYCDYRKVAQLFRDDTSYANPTPIDSSYPVSLGLENLFFEDDISQFATRVIGQGGGSTASTDVGLGGAVVRQTNASSSSLFDSGGTVNPGAAAVKIFGSLGNYGGVIASLLPAVGSTIAFDAVSDGVGGGTTLSWTHVTTGSNRYLVAAIIGAQSNNDYVSGATFNGVAMTLIGKVRTPGDRWLYLFGLVNPASGSHTIAVTTSSTPDALYGYAASYTGVHQTTPLDSFSTGTANTVAEFQLSTAVVGTGCVLVAMAHGGSSPHTSNGARTLPVETTAFFNPAGGTVRCGPQDITYAAIQGGGDGTLVGPGVGPTVPATLTLAPSTGVDVGVHQYAVVFRTTDDAHLSLPSPLATVTTGNAADPISAPTGSLVAADGIDEGDHVYAVTFGQGSGDTLPGPNSAVVTTWKSNPPGAPVSVDDDPFYWSTQGVAPGVTFYVALTAFGSGGNGETPVGSYATHVGAARGGGTACVVVTAPINADPHVAGFNVYQSTDLVNWYNDGSVSPGGTSYILIPGLHIGTPHPGTNTLRKQKVSLANIALGGPGITLRKVWRTAAGGSQLKLLATINDNVTTVLDDATPDAALGANAPSSNTATLQRVNLSNIQIGPPGVTERWIFRTASGASQLKLLAKLTNNTVTVLADSAADATLGANAPTGDSSGLTQPDGVVLSGQTTLIAAGVSWASSQGGWAVIGNGKQVIFYAGLSGNTLIGIPASGIGAITGSIGYNSSITAAPCLIGIPSTGAGSLQYAIKKGDDVNLMVQEDDIGAQATLASLLSVTLGAASDGIQEFRFQDRRLSETETRARAKAHLALRNKILTTVTYTCRDPLTRSGRTITIDRPDLGRTGDFTIQQVDISLFSAMGGKVRPFYPTYAVRASTTRYSLEDVLRRAIAQAA